MSTFISTYLEHTKKYESPTAFWKWSAYATISAVLKDQVFIRQGETYLFPNLYILLLADSSVHRKGRPVDTSEMLVHHANNTKIISGSNSIQAIIDELARVETDATTGKIKKSGSGVFFAQELSAALVEDPRAVKILTDIYDYKPSGYSIRLISRASSKVERLVFSLFGASNEALLKDFFTSQAIYGGLLARTFLVCPDEFRASRSLVKESQEERECHEKVFNTIKDKIKHISTIRGEMFVTDEAAQIYDQWYGPFRDSYRNKNEKSGIIGRIHTHILKLAIILACNDNELTIRARHMEEAIAESLALIPNYRRFLMSIGGTRNKEEAAAFVIDFMMKTESRTATRKQLLQQPQFLIPDGAELLDKIVVTLNQAGLLLENFNVDTREGAKYQLTEKCINIMTKES